MDWRGTGQVVVRSRECPAPVGSAPVGMLYFMGVPPDPLAPGAAFEYRFTGTQRRHVRRLNAWGVMELFLPEAWRCPWDYVISEATPPSSFLRPQSRRSQRSS